MRLQHLQYIAEIENCGSITKAAEKLYVSQPYLSKILRETEEEFQIAIFTRGKNGIQLTESGRLFLDMAKDLLDSAGKFHKTFEERRDSYRLRVSSCASSHSIDAFLRMVEKIPDVDLRFSYKEGNNQDVINDIYTNNADIGVIMVTRSNERLARDLLQVRRIACRPIFNMGTCLVVREGHPLIAKKDSLVLEDIYNYNFVLYPSDHVSGQRVMENVYNDAPLDLINWNRIHQIIYVHCRAALHNVLTRTDYISLGGSAMLESEKNFHIASIPFPFAHRQASEAENVSVLCCIYLKDRELTPAAKIFEQALMEYYGDSSQPLSI